MIVTTIDPAMLDHLDNQGRMNNMPTPSSSHLSFYQFSTHLNLIGHSCAANSWVIAKLNYYTKVSFQMLYGIIPYHL